MKPIWIELVEGGVANRFDFKDHELIEMNWRLTNYPELYKNIFDHEMGHQSGDFKVADFTHDMKTKTPGLWKFMIKNPSSLTQLLPHYYDSRRKAMIYDWSNIISWFMVAGTGAIVFFGLRWLL